MRFSVGDPAPDGVAVHYWRMVTFGAIPLLPCLAYQFRSIGSGPFRILQPGLNAKKLSKTL